MFKNLAAEMARNDITVNDISQCLEVSEKTARNYLKGISKISWLDVLKIRDTLFPSYEVSYLFKISKKDADEMQAS